jgi:hypothetical protein
MGPMKIATVAEARRVSERRGGRCLAIFAGPEAEVAPMGAGGLPADRRNQKSRNASMAQCPWGQGAIRGEWGVRISRDQKEASIGRLF